MEKLTEQELTKELVALIDCKVSTINEKLISLNKQVSDFNDEILKTKELLVKVNQKWLDLGGEISGVKNAELVAINNKVVEHSRAILTLNDLMIDKNAELGTMSKDLATTKEGLEKIKAISVEQVEKLAQEVATKIGEIKAGKEELEKSFLPILEKLNIKTEEAPKE